MAPEIYRRINEDERISKNKQLNVFGISLLSNKSIAGICWAVLVSFILPFLISQKCRREIIILLILLICFFISLLLISNGRAGWLGCFTALIYITYRYPPVRLRKAILILATFFWVLLLLIFFLYKINSSSGRIHIYSISFKMLSKNWIMGVGVGKFKAEFNEYQADYFANHNIDSKRALLADNTFYAFNDYLQLGIETGIAGLLLLALTLYLLIRRITLLQNEYKNKPVIIGAASGLICIATASLFSYPMQVWQIQFLALVFTGIIIFFPLSYDRQFFFRKGLIATARVIFIVLAGFFLFTTVLVLKRKAMAKDIFELARAGYKTKAIEAYKKLITLYPVNGANNLLLAEQLYYSNRLDEALVALNETRKYYVDNKLYKLKAQIENELGKYSEAEKNYLRAIYMVPNRMGSRFDLMNFYISRADTIKAIKWANSILNMPVKVPSERTENMLKATKEVLLKLENR